MAHKSKHRWNWGYLLFAIALVLVFQFLVRTGQTLVLDYSTFLTMLDHDQIAEVTVSEGFIRGTLKEPLEGESAFITQRVEPAIADRIAAHGVRVTGASDTNWLTELLSLIFPAAILFLFWAFLFRRFAERQGMQGMVAVGRSRAKVWMERDTGVTFGDVAGIDEAKAELREVVSFLTQRKRYSRLGAHVPRGILLVGPPGTGKTLLARAVAGEAKVPFFSISGSEFVELFVGVGAARVRDLFDQARKAAPCIIFIDELDALGRARGSFAGFGGNDEKEQTLNQLLAELDGFDPAVGIVLLAATNRPEILDPALTRAGRFDRQVVLDRPERKGRREILAVHFRTVKVAKGLDLDAVAAITPGFTGADLAMLVNEAAILATRRDAAAVEMRDVTEAVEYVIAGAERRSCVLSQDERKRVAVHEMGHALAAARFTGADPVHKVSIIPRSIGALGYTMQRPTEDRFLITEPEMADRLAVLMAGRAAEMIVFGHMSTGAEDDLAQATDIARSMVTRFGMGRMIGPVTLERRPLRWLADTGNGEAMGDYSEATARELDKDVKLLLDAAQSRAQKLLLSERENLDAGAELLERQEAITPDDFPPIQRNPARLSLQPEEAAQ